MRIYFISPNPTWGGAATANMAIAEMLAIDNTVIYNDEYNIVSIKDVIYDSYPVHRLKSSSDLYNHIIEEKIDFVIWGISMNLPYYTKLVSMLKSHGIKQAVLFHSLSISKDFKGRLIEWLTSRVVKHIDHLVFVSKFTDISWSKYRIIRRHASHHVVYNPINISKQKLKSTCTRVGFVGRFSREKQPEIFASLSQCDTTYKFIAWGEGELLDSLKLKYPNVDFRGHSSSKDEIYNSFDVLVMTSLFENCPMVILEAWQYGIPCVVPNVGGIPEIVKNEQTGILFKNYDIDEIVLAIRKISQNYQFYSQNSIEEVTNFSFNNLKTKWNKIMRL